MRGLAGKRGRNEWGRAWCEAMPMLTMFVSRSILSHPKKTEK